MIRHHYIRLSRRREAQQLPYLPLLHALVGRIVQEQLDSVRPGFAYDDPLAPKIVRKKPKKRKPTERSRQLHTPEDFGPDGLLLDKHRLGELTPCELLDGRTGGRLKGEYVLLPKADAVRWTALARQRYHPVKFAQRSEIRTIRGKPQEVVRVYKLPL